MKDDEPEKVEEDASQNIDKNLDDSNKNDGFQKPNEEVKSKNKIDYDNFKNEEEKGLLEEESWTSSDKDEVEDKDGVIVKHYDEDDIELQKSNLAKICWICKLVSSIRIFKEFTFA